jgi:hypothetical protein
VPTGDPQCAVAAIGAELQHDLRIRPLHRRVEQPALDVADIDQQRLVVGVPVQGPQHIIDITLARMADHIVDDRAFPPITDLTGLAQPVRTEHEPPE